MTQLEKKMKTCADNLGKPSEIQNCVYTALEGEGEAAAPSAPPEDVCPNIEGVQTQVPAGMAKDANGNCVTAQAPTGLAALTGAVISALKTPGGIIIALTVLILVGAAGYGGYYYLYRRRKDDIFK